MSDLFKEYKLGQLRLSNRVIMAPMTRARAQNGNTPDENTAIYYKQRASAGLIISEGAQISVQGQGFLFTPGIYNKEQIEGWRKTTKAVHDSNGKIFLQLWHVGRLSHTSLQVDNAKPVSSVAKKALNTNCYALNEEGKPGLVPASEPEALSISQITKIVDDFAIAAKNAIEAGFDGVEIHGANSYLIEQFINAGLNVREDKYGGRNLEDRLRLALEVTDAVVAAIGAEKTGIRLSPFGRIYDLHAFEGEEDTWLHLAKELSNRNIAYVHLSDQKSMGEQAMPDGFLKKFRDAYKGTLIIAGGFNRVKAEEYLAGNLADLIAFGKPYIPNPDLVERMKNDWPLAEPFPISFYGGNNHGYTDYPNFSDAKS